MALKLGPGTTLPPQHPAVPALPPPVVTSAIDCSEISPSLPPAAIATPVPQTKPVAASLESSKMPEKPEDVGRIKTRPLSTVMPCEQKWLWMPYLAAGMLAMLLGNPGVGKTWIALAIAAALTRGRTPFSGEPRPPAHVVYFCIETPPQELRRRFDSLGGNSELLHITDDPVRLSDIEGLNAAMKKDDARLMVFDPIQSFLGSGVDMYRPNKTRPILDDLSLLAKNNDCCVLLLGHLTKARSDRAIHRSLGGVDLIAAARTALLAGCAAHDANQRGVVQIKSNFSQMGASLGYALGPGFSWMGVSELTEQELLAPDSPRMEGAALTEAKEFLVTTLSQGPRLMKQLETEAKEAGISFMTLKRAKRKLNVGSKTIGQSGPSEWSLPEGAQSFPTQTHDPLPNLEEM
jgi:hypothetical protein